MKLSFEELKKSIIGYIGERNDDVSLKLLEDVSDTMVSDGTDWKLKYDELDAEWRKRYRERFNAAVPDGNDETTEFEQVQIEEPEEKKVSYDDLFEEKEG